jgi:hypothetical protein
MPPLRRGMQEHGWSNGLDDQRSSHCVIIRFSDCRKITRDQSGNFISLIENGKYFSAISPFKFCAYNHLCGIYLEV